MRATHKLCHSPPRPALLACRPLQNTSGLVLFHPLIALALPTVSCLQFRRALFSCQGGGPPACAGDSCSPLGALLRVAER